MLLFVETMRNQGTFKACTIHDPMSIVKDEGIRHPIFLNRIELIILHPSAKRWVKCY